MIKNIKHLGFILKIRENELLDIASNIDAFYREKIEYKLNKDGSPKLDKLGQPKVRVLYPSQGRLKIIQRRINQRILQDASFFDTRDYAFGAIKKRDNVKNARMHQGKKYIFTTDLKRFFPSISHRAVFNLFTAKEFSPTVARLLTKLTTYKGQLPQGAPTSSTLANLVFQTTGDKLADWSKSNDVTFTQFVDDLTFSRPKDFQTDHKTIISMITDDGYKIAFSKTNYKTKNPNVTGVVIKNNNLDLPKEFNTKLEAAKLESPERFNGLRLYQQKVLAGKKQGR